MLRDIFNSMGNIGIYGVISTVIFAVFFFALALHALFLNKTETERYGEMPLDDLTRESEEIKDL
jgi:hypothetical protein